MQTGRDNVAFLKQHFERLNIHYVNPYIACVTSIVKKKFKTETRKEI